MTTEVDNPGEQTPSDTPDDATLIAAVRGGDSHAFAALHDRHHHAAARLASTLTAGPVEADDLVARAFGRALSGLQEGNGPDLAFREYLHTTVREIAEAPPVGAGGQGEPPHLADPAAPGSDQAAPGPEQPAPGPEQTPPAPAQAAARDQQGPTGSGLAARAFRTLPERWRVALWHTAVEGDEPAVVARLLGLTPSGVSAATHRARERLRQAYLEAHLADIPVTATCSEVAGLLAASTRDNPAGGEHTRLSDHLAECTTCTARFAEFAALDTDLAAVLAPTVLGPTWEAYLGVSRTVPKPGLAATVAGLSGLTLTRLRHGVTRIGAALPGPRYTAIGAGAAAAIALVALVAMMLPGDPAPTPARSDPPAAAEPTPSELPSTTPGVSPSGSPSAAPSGRTGKSGQAPGGGEGRRKPTGKAPRTPKPSTSSPSPCRSPLLPPLLRGCPSGWLTMPSPDLFASWF